MFTAAFHNELLNIIRNLEQQQQQMMMMMDAADDDDGMYAQLLAKTARAIEEAQQLQQFMDVTKQQLLKAQEMEQRNAQLLNAVSDRAAALVAEQQRQRKSIDAAAAGSGDTMERIKLLCKELDVVVAAADDALMMDNNKENNVPAPIQNRELELHRTTAGMTTATTANNADAAVVVVVENNDAAFDGDDDDDWANQILRELDAADAKAPITFSMSAGTILDMIRKERKTGHISLALAYCKIGLEFLHETKCKTAAENKNNGNTAQMDMFTLAIHRLASNLHARKSNFAAALQHGNRALEYSKKIYGKNNPTEVAFDLLNLARIYEKQLEYRKAYKLYCAAKRVLTVTAKHGAEHKYTKKMSQMVITGVQRCVTTLSAVYGPDWATTMQNDSSRCSGISNSRTTNAAIPTTASMTGSSSTRKNNNAENTAANKNLFPTRRLKPFVGSKMAQGCKAANGEAIKVDGKDDHNNINNNSNIRRTPITKKTMEAKNVVVVTADDANNQLGTSEI